jgi:hypothetical protein
MSNPTIKQNVLPADPTLKDLLDLHKKDILLSLNCHHIGTVQSFNATTQQAQATINYKKTYFEFDQQTGAYNPILKDYPLLMDCPCIVLGGGSAALTFPIQQGDECLVLFNDRNLDNWFQSGGNGAVASPRLHAFADGIILVGLRSSPHVLTGYDTSRAVLRNGEALVGVGSTLIKIANNTTTLNTLLQNLITQIAAITVTGVTSGGGTSGPPANAAAIAAIGTQLSGLLE